MYGVTTDAPRLTAALLATLLALGTPLSWKKTFVGETNTWLGFVVNPREPSVMMARSKHLTVMALLTRLHEGHAFSSKEVEQALGRIQWATTCFPMTKFFFNAWHGKWHARLPADHPRWSVCWQSCYFSFFVVPTDNFPLTLSAQRGGDVVMPVPPKRHCICGRLAYGFLGSHKRLGLLVLYPSCSWKRAMALRLAGCPPWNCSL